MRIPSFLAVLVGLTLLSPSLGGARTKLSALPERDSTAVRLDNPSATLVEEDRVLTLQPGENRVDFSWQGVRIDAESIRLEFLSHPREVRLLSVAYPPGEAALVWNIHSPEAWEERVRIVYLLSDIDRLTTYKALAATDEKTLDLEAFLILRNFSGEDFPQAQIDTGNGKSINLPSAYEETRQVRLWRVADVPVSKVLTWDADRMPWEPKRQQREVGIPVHYLLETLALAPAGALWAGKVRVFQRDGHGGTLFLGEDQVNFTPPGEKLKVYIGESRDVVVTQQKIQEQRINIRPSKFEPRLYDSDEILETEVENFKNQVARVELVQHIVGEWELSESSHPFERQDAFTVVFPLDVPAEESTRVRFHYRRRNIRP